MEAKEIKKMESKYRELLTLLDIDVEEIDDILRDAGDNYDYDEIPPFVVLNILFEEDICCELDWKFALEDVEYNINMIADKLGMKPIKEYPPYQEGQPLGYEALRLIASEMEHKAIAIPDGDTLYVFLTSEQKAAAVAGKLQELLEYFGLDEVFIVE